MKNGGGTASNSHYVKCSSSLVLTLPSCGSAAKKQHDCNARSRLLKAEDLRKSS